MEGGVYVCGWKRGRTKYALWLQSHPQIKVEGQTYNEAHEALSKAVCLQLGDGEAVFEFNPPLPKSAIERKYLNPELVTISGGNTACDATNAGALFTYGVCKKCHRPVGERTAEPLVIKSIEPGSHGGFISHSHIVFYSGGFLKLLTAQERKQFEWRKVMLEGRSKKVFYEFIAEKAIPLVPVKGLIFQTWICGTCNQQMPWMHYGIPKISRFVSSRDLSARPPSCFAVRMGNVPELGITRVRWRALVGRPETKGLLANDIGVVLPSEIDRDAPVYTEEVWRKLSEEKNNRWNILRDRWLKSPEAEAMRKNPRRSFNDIYEFIHSKVDKQLAFRKLNKEFGYPEWDRRRLP